MNEKLRIALILEDAWKLAFDIAVRTMTIEEAQKEAWMRVGGSVYEMLALQRGGENESSPSI